MTYEESQKHDCIYEKFEEWFISVSDCSFNITKAIKKADGSKTFEYPDWGEENKVPAKIKKVIYKDIETAGAINISGWYQIKSKIIFDYINKKLEVD
jgi:hypothetical protein